MADILRTGGGALSTFQRAIATTSHNIANSATEGYTRQRTEIEALPPATRTYGFVGVGSTIAGIERVEEYYIQQQILHTGGELERLNALHSYASEVDNLLAKESSSIEPAINQFFGAMQDSLNDPTNITTRDLVVRNVENVSRQFGLTYQSLETTRNRLHSDFTLTIDEINDLTTQIATLNESIMNTRAATTSRSSSDLIDQRNRLVEKLGDLVSINTVEGNADAINVFLDNGQSLVTDTVSRQLFTEPNQNQPVSTSIFIHDGTRLLDISDKINGGKIGGMVEFERAVLLPSYSELGRIATVVAMSMNEQHRYGIDINGASGLDLFNLPDFDGAGESTNTGNAVVTGTVTDYTQLKTSDYELSYDGANYQLTRLSDNNSVTGSVPLSLDGFSVDFTGSMAAGDRFRINPTRYAAGKISAAIQSGEELALAFPVRTSVLATNDGSTSSSLINIDDPTDPALTVAVELVFDNPPTTFSMVDQGTGATLEAGIGYTEGMQLNRNGWSVMLDGTPEPGDIVVVEPASGAVADNANGIKLAALIDAQLVEGQQNIIGSLGGLVSTVGFRTRQAELNQVAANSLHEGTLERRDNVSAVSLDEEAVDLARYQQAYQAAARIITTADQLFESLLGAIR